MKITAVPLTLRTRALVLLVNSDFGLYLVATLEDISSVTLLESYVPGTSMTSNIVKLDSDAGVDLGLSLGFIPLVPWWEGSAP